MPFDPNDPNFGEDYPDTPTDPDAGTDGDEEETDDTTNPFENWWEHIFNPWSEKADGNTVGFFVLYSIVIICRICYNNLQD